MPPRRDRRRSEPEEHPIARRRGRKSPRRRLWLAIGLPIAVSIFSQFEFVQQSDCVVARLPWEVGHCEVMADLIAPLWALAIVPVSRRLQKAARTHGRAPDPGAGWLANRIGTPLSVDGAGRAARVGAVLIVGLAYTREWERFNQQPDAVWYGLVIGATLALLLVPIWWLRDHLHDRGVAYLSEGRTPRAVQRFLFDADEGTPQRWAHVLAFSLVTLVVSTTVLGQLDALVRGMHQPEDPSVGISSLASIYEFDLSEKPDLVVERVQSWQAYNSDTGTGFGSARSVVLAHVVIDGIVRVGAALLGVVTLLFLAWRYRLGLTDAAVRRAFELLVLFAFCVLVIAAAAALLADFFTWYVMDRAWTDPDLLTNANVRLLWFFALVRALGTGLLVLTGLVALALAPLGLRRLKPALIAVRSEVLLLAVFALVVLMLPQTADVIRDWRVSHVLVTLGLVVALSMLMRWTSAANLRLQQRHRRLLESGVSPEPKTVAIPFGGGATTTLKRFGASLIVVAAVVQFLISVTTPVDLGRGLVIPAAIVLVLALIGLGLPPAPFTRGDRPVSRAVRRRIPRLLGAGFYLVVGVAVLKAASGEVAYARHEDWYLLFALVPPLIGVRRILSRTTHTLGALEGVFTAVLVVLAAVLLIEGGNPELSPAALMFAGVTLAYGSLAYFNSYHEASWVSRFTTRYVRGTRARPFVLAASIALVASVVAFYVDPIAVAPAIGTIGMIVMAIMMLTLVGAGAVRFAEITRPPKIMAAIGISRSPMVLLIAAWLVFGPTVSDQSTNDLRVMATGSGAPTIAERPGFDDVWTRWAANNLPDAGGGAASPRRVIPMLLVSSSGGGLRATAWTSFVLDCIFERTTVPGDPCGGTRTGTSLLGRVAVMSGVSGGSLGVAVYTAHVVDGVDGPDGSNAWVDAVLGDDYLAAPVGWLFFADLPRTLLGFGAGIENRSDVMERAWEASWPGDGRGLQHGVLDLWLRHHDVPPAIFNGTSVNDACRFNASALDVDGATPGVPSCSGTRSPAQQEGDLAATHDLVDFLCPGDDVRLSTAAGLGARFPVVSVSGRVTPDPDRTCGGRPDATVFVVDGGYLEGSGSGTLLDVWQALAPMVEAHNAGALDHCVVPFMVHIDNGYERPAVSGSEAVPREFLVPLAATLSTSSGITGARAEAALAFTEPFTIAGTPIDVVVAEGGERLEGRYRRLVTLAHPGVQAPLGWTLSQASVDDLRDQLAIESNAAAIEQIRVWLEGELMCSA